MTQLSLARQAPFLDRAGFRCRPGSHASARARQSAHRRSRCLSHCGPVHTLRRIELTIAEIRGLGSIHFANA